MEHADIISYDLSQLLICCCTASQQRHGHAARFYLIQSLCTCTVRIVFLFQLLEGSLAVAGNFTGAGRIALEDLQHHGALTVQAGKAVLRVVNDLHIGHVRQADIAKAVHMEISSMLSYSSPTFSSQDLLLESLT